MSLDRPVVPWDAILIPPDEQSAEDLFFMDKAMELVSQGLPRMLDSSTRSSREQALICDSTGARGIRGIRDPSRLCAHEEWQDHRNGTKSDQ